MYHLGIFLPSPWPPKASPPWLGWLRLFLHLNTLDHLSHIGVDEFREINWLNVTDRFNQCVSASVFKYFNNISPTYMAEIFNPISRNDIGTRNSFLKLTQLSRRTKQGQNCLSFIGPSIWNKLPEIIKDSNNLNSFKHKVKEHFLNENERRENNIYIFISERKIK